MRNDDRPQLQPKCEKSWTLPSNRDRRRVGPNQAIAVGPSQIDEISAKKKRKDLGKNVTVAVLASFAVREGGTSMKLDANATVLCNRHRKPMHSVVSGVRSELGDFWCQDYWRCEVPGCTRQFTPNLGYVNIEDGRIENGFTMLKLCGKREGINSMHTSMAIRAYENNVPIWQCVARTCSSRGAGYPHP